jgi:hypothetical protein
VSDREQRQQVHAYWVIPGWEGGARERPPTGLEDPADLIMDRARGFGALPGAASNHMRNR